MSRFCSVTFATDAKLNCKPEPAMPIVFITHLPAYMTSADCTISFTIVTSPPVICSSSSVSSNVSNGPAAWPTVLPSAMMIFPTKDASLSDVSRRASVLPVGPYVSKLKSASSPVGFSIAEYILGLFPALKPLSGASSNSTE